jgi:two-component system, sensor histidine kinase PdtaS
VPPLLVELAVGVAAAGAMLVLRVSMDGVAADRAPYALNFLAIVLAAVVAGWRGGAVALLLGQLGIWYVIVSPYWSMAILDTERLGGFVVASISQALVLLVIGLYQREVDKGAAEVERRMELLDHALHEIDHRTRNNYQTVLALIRLQAQQSKEPDVKAALQQVADRIQAIASASERLALRSGDIERVKLDDHLCELCEQIERGISRDEIELDCRIDSVTADADTATSISIIVNELVTNAIKHAFNGERSGNVWVTGTAGKIFQLVVADDGLGIKAKRGAGRSGLGTKLVDSFVKQLGAKHEVVSTDKGTTHRLFIPSLD